MAQIAAVDAATGAAIIFRLSRVRPKNQARVAAFFCAKAETRHIPAISISMKPLKTIQEMRAEIAALIAEAVPEKDDMRRRALLVMADHWRELIDRRRASPA